MRVCVFVFLSAQWAVDVNLRALLVVQSARQVELPVPFVFLSVSPLSSPPSSSLSLCESTDSKRMSTTMGQ